MAKVSKYAVHEDFQKFPVVNFKYNRAFMGFINVFFKFERWLTQRKTLRQAVLHELSMPSGDVLKVYEFKPSQTALNQEQGPRPAIVYFHGGAFVMTFASSHIASVDYFAKEMNCSVFMVDYRLAQDQPFPAAFDDSYAASKWVVENAQSLNIDPARLVLMGDSAGGGLAAGVAQKALDTKEFAVAGQLLVYPTVDKSGATRTAEEYIDTPMWNSLNNEGMWNIYLRNFADAQTPTYAAPADRDDLSNLPFAYVETAEFDPLCDEGIAYARRLEHAGVEVLLNETKGTIHGYDTVLSSQITQEALQQRKDFLTRCFA